MNHLMFADVICVFGPRISGFQCHLNICDGYTSEHESTLKCSKTIDPPFCPKKYKQPASSNAFLNGVNIQFSGQVKYLGVLLNVSLNDNNDTGP